MKIVAKLKDKMTGNKDCQCLTMVTVAQRLFTSQSNNKIDKYLAFNTFVF
jgi:hypothetical protein